MNTMSFDFSITPGQIVAFVLLGIAILLLLFLGHLQKQGKKYH